MKTVEQIISADELSEFACQNMEPDWLIEKRLLACEQMKTLDFPNVLRFNYRNWQMTSDLLAWIKSDKHLINCVLNSNGLVQFGQTTLSVNLSTELKQQGVILTDLFTAARYYPELVHDNFMTKAIKTDDNFLASYHAACLTSGIFLYVPDNVEFKEPIELNLIQDSTQVSPLVSHTLIVAGANTKFSVIQQINTKGSQANLANAFVEVIAQENSHVNMSSLDELGENTLAYLQRRAAVGRNAHVNWAIGMMNDGDTVGNFALELNGDGAQAKAKVVAITKHRQRVGINTGIKNVGKHTVGDILQRGVILDDSQLVFNGIGDIVHGASGSESEQENRILMMSNNAHGNANPILLIDENDVLAGHAASVGQVDQSQLYYLMSRGLSRVLAERLVIRGFLGAVLTVIPLKTVQQKLIKIIERKLADGHESD